jgi:hypothetical protein
MYNFVFVKHRDKGFIDSDVQEFRALEHSCVPSSLPTAIPQYRKRGTVGTTCKMGRHFALSINNTILRPVPALQIRTTAHFTQTSLSVYPHY